MDLIVNHPINFILPSQLSRSQSHIVSLFRYFPSHRILLFALSPSPHCSRLHPFSLVTLSSSSSYPPSPPTSSLPCLTLSPSPYLYLSAFEKLASYKPLYSPGPCSTWLAQELAKLAMGNETMSVRGGQEDRLRKQRECSQLKRARRW